MKYYVRYFDDETMVDNLKEAMDFLSGLDGVEMDEACVEQLTSYFTTDQKGSKKIFMPNHRSFLIIKTTVNTMDEFKAYDRMPPNNPDACCDNGVCSRLIVDSPFVVDNCNNIKYNILDGSIIEGDGVYPLIEYHTMYDGDVLRIYN